MAIWRLSGWANDQLCVLFFELGRTSARKGHDSGVISCPFSAIFGILLKSDTIYAHFVSFSCTHGCRE